LFHEKQIAIIGGAAAFLLAAFRSSKFQLQSMKKTKLLVVNFGCW
jgi:hypothetical protein